MNEFAYYGIGDEITKALSLMHYEKPTKVQEMVIPEVLGGRDLIVKAKTGSGKTAAYGIPLCEMVQWEENRPQALILAPTRELAIQIKEEIFHIGRYRRMKVPVLFGQSPFAYQANELRLKSHIVVGTPGRVLDHIEQGTFDTTALKFLVLDEADEMLKMGFLEQIQDILRKLPAERCTMLFSATFGDEMQKVAKNYMKQPILVEPDEDSLALTVDNICEMAYIVDEADRKRMLLLALEKENPDSSIIFCNTQVEVEEVCRYLNQQGCPAMKIHGGMNQKDRIRVMEKMKQGSIRYLVATDVAARGIDIQQIGLVVNYSVPVHRETYVHRIGRTGRIGSKGRAVTFFESKEEFMELCTYTGSKIEIMTLPDQTAMEQYKTAFFEKIKQRPNEKKDRNEQLNADIMKLHINAGRKTKMRPADVVGAICSVDGVSADDIGVITIQDISTFVEILNGKGELVFQALQDRNIKGRKRRISKKETQK